MPHHQIFNERPESQDRALKELQAMGYQYIPRAEAEQKRGHLSHVLFPDVMREFLASQSFIYRGKQTPFPDDAIGEAIRELDPQTAQAAAMTNSLHSDEEDDDTLLDNLDE